MPDETDTRDLMGRAVMAFMREGGTRMEANRKAGEFVKFYKKQKPQKKKKPSEIILAQD